MPPFIPSVPVSGKVCTPGPRRTTFGSSGAGASSGVPAMIYTIRCRSPSRERVTFPGWRRVRTAVPSSIFSGSFFEAGWAWAAAIGPPSARRTRTCTPPVKSNSTIGLSMTGSSSLLFC